MNYRDDLYRGSVYRTGQFKTQTSNEAATMGAMGLAGEAGEVCDLIKKQVFHAKPVDREKLLNELGDVRFYFEYLLINFGFTMEEVEEANMNKLNRRYPNGFSPEAAAARKDET
jgi:NTP pyrophosphatase (non-canonical NTP hydrolase)